MLMMMEISAVCSDFESVVAAKSQLRQQIITARHKMSAPRRRAASAIICQQLLEFIAVHNAVCIAAFAPMPEEVDIWPVIHTCQQAGKTVAFPRVSGKRQIDFYIATQQQLQKGFKSILEPPNYLPPIRPQDFDLAIIPAVAIDINFFRLGYGGGFYDTFKPKLNHSSLMCAPVFRCQRLTWVPTQSHDIKVSFVFSE